jgi:dynein heavy chain 2
MNDPRKEYVVQCIISALNIPRNDFRSNTASNAALEKFLDDPNEKVLQAVENTSGEKSKRTVTLAPGFNNMIEGCTEMHFVKLSNEPLTEENIKTNVMISSLRQSPVNLMNDPRNEYIISCISSVLGIPRNMLRFRDTACLGSLSKFLDDPNEKVLQAVEVEASEGGRVINLACNFETYADGSNEVHFVKLSYAPLTQENLCRDVMISSLRMSPARSLFYTVRDIFVPLLVQSSGKAEVLEGRLADCLVEMEAGLNASLRRGLRQRQQSDEADLSGIISPIDEVRFWAEYKNATGISEAVAERAAKFAEALAPIGNDLDDMNKKSFPQLMDSMETFTDALDTLWQCDAEPPYPRARMLHFLKLIAGSLGRSVQAKLNGLNVWTAAFSQISKHVREGHKVCEKWNEVLGDLTGVQWRTTENVWEGEAYKDAYLTAMAQRISEVSQIRSQHDQILKLLPQDAQNNWAVQVDNCFEPFTKLAAFSYNEYTVPIWKSALAEYEARMIPIESQVAERLRGELFTDKSNPAQTVRVFQRYQDLLERKNIRDVLTNERERLLTELGDFVERILHELETFDPNNLPGGRGLSIHARKMMWVEHLRSKADLAARPLSGFLKDLHAVPKLSASCKRVRQDLKEYRSRTFKEWQDEVESQLNHPDDPIALEMNSRVMDFDTAQQGALKITYSERLIQLVKEARLFEQMGCNIPSKVKQAVQNGMKFYRFAVQLKQICNFYNNLSAELLPSQKFMVLQPALAFEQLFSDKQSGMKKVQWAKLDQLEAFTRNVKDGAERLRSVNRRLRNGHSQVNSEVVQLANVSLLRQRDLWKQKLAQIQKSIDITVQACGCEAQDAKPWKAHWDYQIFKIMEVQYRFGLESLNENLTEMKADLVFTNKQLKLKPPLEELKTNYYKEIKNFISLPSSFKGLEGASHIYKAMPDRNQQGIAVVFQKAEDLFSKVQKLQASFSPWMVVGLLSERMSELVDELQEPRQWDLNFKCLKAKRKDMDKIPDTIKIDCLTISTVVLKSVIEEHLERLSDALVLSLKRKVMEEVKNVSAFLVQALETLNVRPDSVSELGKAQAEARELQERQGDVKKLMDSADEKNKMLRNVATGVDTTDVHSKFEEFHIRLEAFETLAAELREELRGKMDQRIITMNGEIEKFASRWQSLKPKTAADCSLDEAKKERTSNAGMAK